MAPFAMDLGDGAAKAMWAGMAEFQMAWPFTQLVIGDLDNLWIAGLVGSLMERRDVSALQLRCRSGTLRYHGVDDERHVRAML